jgi:hypothetical protein
MGSEAQYVKLHVGDVPDVKPVFAATAYQLLDKKKLF